MALSIRLVCVLFFAVLALPACHRQPRPLPPLELDLPRPDPGSKELERFLSAAELGDGVSPGRAPLARLDGDGVGLTAPELRRLTLEQHPEVVAAGLALRQAQAAVESAGQWPNPELEGKLVFDMEGQPGGEAAVKFPIPLGGRVGAGRQRAQLAVTLARRELDAARRRALAQVEKAMADLSLARARLRLFEKLQKRSAQYAELARSRREASLADSVDVALVLADAARDRRRVSRARAQGRQAQVELLRLCGLDVASSVGLRLPALKRQKLREDLESLWDAAQKRSDVIARAQLAFRLADSLVAQRAAERWPDMRLGPAVVGEAGGVAIGLALGLELPVLQRRDGELAEARLGRDRAAEALRQHARNLKARLRNRLMELQALDGELDGLLDEAAGELDQATALAEVRFSSGRLDVLRLLGVHRAFASLQLEYLDLLYAQRIALINLEEIVGRPLRQSSPEDEK